jgi:hypothetical protein
MTYFDGTLPFHWNGPHNCDDNFVTTLQVRSWLGLWGLWLNMWLNKFKQWFWGGGVYFSLCLMCSHYILIKFPVSSQKVPNFNIFPKTFPIAPQFYPICFGKYCPPGTYIGEANGRNPLFSNGTFHFGEAPWFQFFFGYGQSS